MLGRIKLKIESKNKLFIFVVLVFILITNFLLMKDKINHDHVFPIYASAENEESIRITNTDKVYQNFNIANKNINAIILRTSQKRGIDRAVLGYKIFDKDVEIVDGNIELNKIPQDTDINIYLRNELENVNKKDLTLSLELESGSEIFLQSTKHGQLCMSVLSQETTNYMKSVTVIGVIVILFSIFAYLCIYKFNWELYKVFFVSALVLGSVFCFLIPIDNVPDEANAHITTAYHFSNKFLGIKDDSHNVKERRSDLQTVYNFAHVDNNKFVRYLAAASDNSNIDETLVNSNMGILQVGIFSFTYYLSAIGIAIGRLLSLNGILCLILGRLMNFILFLAVATYSIKKLKCFKNIMMFVYLLPMTLQQAFSLSYDSMVISLAIIIMTLTLNLFYEKKLTKKEIGVLVVSCVLISLCKHFAYAPIAFAPMSYFLTKINFKKIFSDKRFKILAILLVFICLLLGCAIILYLKTYAAEGSMLYLIAHPKVLYKTVRSTLNVFSEYYISSSLGGSMGLLDIQVNKAIMMVYYMFMFYVVTNSNDKRNVIPLYIAYVFGAIFLVSFLGILISMYSWSFSGGILQNNLVLGFQGRYMLPVMPLLFVAISSRCTEKNNNDHITKNVAYTSIYLNVLTMFSIMMTLG